jgi:hypothetical protein
VVSLRFDALFDIMKSVHGAESIEEALVSVCPLPGPSLLGMVAESGVPVHYYGKVCGNGGINRVAMVALFLRRRAEFPDAALPVTAK